MDALVLLRSGAEITAAIVAGVMALFAAILGIMPARVSLRQPMVRGGRGWRPRPLILVLVVSFSCRPSDQNTVRLPTQTAERGDDPPVMINSEPPVEYPAALFERGIEGKVLLRLYTDQAGRLVSDSTRLAESSGYPALDSAALAAAPLFRFAPALKNGVPVAATFLQPIHFRHPQAGGTTP